MLFGMRGLDTRLHVRNSIRQPPQIGLHTNTQDGAVCHGALHPNTLALGPGLMVQGKTTAPEMS